MGERQPRRRLLVAEHRADRDPHHGGEQCLEPDLEDLEGIVPYSGTLSGQRILAAR